MIFEHEAEIRGKMSDQIAVDSTVELPKIYTAKILKTTKVYYSMDKEDEYYYLVSLT
jgi:hypothetical protein